MKLAAIFLAVAALVTGLLFQDNHYRLRQLGQPADQAVLDHRDSAYTSMTWVGSPSENYLQLRFFDKVEGGLGLHPTWAELGAMATAGKPLGHLWMETVSGGAPAAASWPAEQPDPGTLPTSHYVRFFPAGVLLNNALVNKAGGDLRLVDPHVLVIGLGSSAGLLVLAHHFPQASITCVDIDQKVIDIVHDQVPLARWLQEQKTADGSPRLTLVAKDARQFVRFDAVRQSRSRPYDLVILDAYTAGSTIPSHLMTSEFFNECSKILAPEGMVLGNIIGSYTGDKRRVVGGCLRSLRAGGLPEAYNIPVISAWTDSPSQMDPKQARNNIVLASRAPLDPKRNASGWERLLAFIPFPELAVDTYKSTQYLLYDNNGLPITSYLPGEAVDVPEPSLAVKMQPILTNPQAPQYATLAKSEDSVMISTVRTLAAKWYETNRVAKKLVGTPMGWDSLQQAKTVYRREVDWVKATREIWHVSLRAARDANAHGGEALVGPVEGPEREQAEATWKITDAPLFTDQMPNADIVNH